MHFRKTCQRWRISREWPIGAIAGAANRCTFYFPRRIKKNWSFVAELRPPALARAAVPPSVRHGLSDKLFFPASGICIALHCSRRDIRMHCMKRDWYVVYSKPHKEEQVRLHLGLKGIESFFPRLQMPASPRRKPTITPLFPNYLFVRIAFSSEAHWVVWSPGIKRIVSFGDAPIALEDQVVEFLKERADAQGVIRAQSQFSMGQKVEITGGPFNGFLGIIENPPNAQGRVQVLLKLLSRQISVKLGVEFIKDPLVTILPAKTGAGALSAQS